MGGGGDPPQQSPAVGVRGAGRSWCEGPAAQRGDTGLLSPWLGGTGPAGEQQGAGGPGHRPPRVHIVPGCPPVLPLGARCSLGGHRWGGAICPQPGRAPLPGTGEGRLCWAGSGPPACASADSPKPGRGSVGTFLPCAVGPAPLPPALLSSVPGERGRARAPAPGCLSGWGAGSGGGSGDNGEFPDPAASGQRSRLGCRCCSRCRGCSTPRCSLPALLPPLLSQ